MYRYSQHHIMKTNPSVNTKATRTATQSKGTIYCGIHSSVHGERIQAKSKKQFNMWATMKVGKQHSQDALEGVYCLCNSHKFSLVCLSATCRGASQWSWYKTEGSPFGSELPLIARTASVTSGYLIVFVLRSSLSASAASLARQSFPLWLEMSGKLFGLCLAKTWKRWEGRETDD